MEILLECDSQRSKAEAPVRKALDVDPESVPIKPRETVPQKRRRRRRKGQPLIQSDATPEVSGAEAMADLSQGHEMMFEETGLPDKLPDDAELQQESSQSKKGFGELHIMTINVHGLR